MYVSVVVELSTADIIENDPHEVPVIISSSWSNVVVEEIVVLLPSPVN